MRLASLVGDVGLALTRGGRCGGKCSACVRSRSFPTSAGLCRIWTLDEAERLELQAGAGLYTHLDGPHGRVPVGKFKIGLIAEDAGRT